MQLVVKPNQDFQGKLNEVVPESFRVSGNNGLQQNTQGDENTLSWDVNYLEGETYTYTYIFDAPDISPEFYQLGPIQVDDFTEYRKWQIANDDLLPYAFPEADGSDDNWSSGTTDCTSGDCYVEVDSESGSECASGGGGAGNGSDSATYISSSTLNERQSFDIDISAIPDGSVITNLEVIGCIRATGGNGSLKVFADVDGTDYDGSTTYSIGSSFTEVGEGNSFFGYKASDTEVEIGVISLTSSIVNHVTELYALINYIPPIVETQSAYRWFANDDSTDVGSALAAQDTAATAPTQGTPFRLRMAVHMADYDATQYNLFYVLQYAEKVGTCDASFTGETYGDVSPSSGAIRYYNNTTPSDGTALTDNANDPVHSGHTNYNQDYEEANYVINNQSTIPDGSDALWDFSLVDFSAAQGASYCFRLVFADYTPFENYDVIPEITTESDNTLPVASSVSIDSGATGVNLTENTTTEVSCTATVTDSDGYADISSVKAELHRSAVAAGSTDDNNNHYTLEGDSECIPSGGTGTTETYTCDFDVQYYADPTDDGTYSAQNWECLVTPSDSVGAGTTDSDTIEMNSLSSLNVTSTVSYGSVTLGSNTGASNQTVTITNTGNVNIDTQFSGTDMTCTIGSASSSNQKYGTTDVTYASLTNSLSGTPTERDLDISQRTDDATPSTKATYWGLAMPSTGVGGSCSGTNTITAVNDIDVD